VAGRLSTKNLVLFKYANFRISLCFPPAEEEAKRGKNYAEICAVPTQQDWRKVRVKSWEIIADRISKVGWSLGWVSAVDSRGRTIWIVDAHRGDGKRFIVHADIKLGLAIRNAFRVLQRKWRRSINA
jgi:hypothetical protein